MEQDSAVKIWESSGYKVPYIPYTYKHVFEIEKAYWDPFKVHKFIVDNWHFSLLIAIAYIFLIHTIKACMRPLKPLKLSRPLIIWNIILAIFSIVGTLRSGEEFLNVLQTKNPIYNSICISYDPAGVASLWNFMFITSKVAELVDTIFIVLRKKPLIFLHWYHHAAVLIVVWHGAKMIIAPSRVYIIMNFFVHSFMYTYYALTAMGIRPNRLCAMFVTTIQNIQMLIGILIAVSIAKIKWFDKDFCHMSDEDLFLCFFVYATFGVLFCNFFINAYLKKAKSDEKKTN